MALICPECGEEAVPGTPNGARQMRALGVALERLAHKHKDGEPLCPVPGGPGRHPAMPRKAKR